MPPKPSYRIPSKPQSFPAPRNSQPSPLKSKIKPQSNQPYTSSPPSPPPSRSIPPFFRTIFLTAGYTLFAGGTFLFIRDSIISIDTVKGSSMAPTLSPGAHERGEHDMVLIKRIAATKDLQRGDVVTFWKPHKVDEVSIKRIVGLEGDTVFPHRGYAFEEETVGRKRVAMNDGLENNKEEEEPGPGSDGKVIVPFGHVWVEGDNWRRSFDSCDFGPISKSLIDGKAVRVWRRGWWRDIAKREEEKEGMSRVVEGRNEMPDVFLD